MGHQEISLRNVFIVKLQSCNDAQRFVWKQKLTQLHVYDHDHALFNEVCHHYDTEMITSVIYCDEDVDDDDDEDDVQKVLFGMVVLSGAAFVAIYYHYILSIYCVYW